MPKNVTLLDGGMGQELLKRSKQPAHPMWSAKVLLDEPEIVEAAHIDFIKAGANVITINSYSATPERLARDSGDPDGADDLFIKLQARAIELAQSAREKAKPKYEVKIAGCLPPLYGSYKPESAPSEDVMLDMYHRIVAQQSKDVDFIICETMSSIAEGRASATAAIDCGLPVWLAYSLADDMEMTLRSGESLVDAIEAVSKIDIDAVLLNCSVPEAISTAMPTLQTVKGLKGAYANAFTSITALNLGGTVDGLKAREDLGPEAYAQFAMNWVSQGVRIIGGCCEVGPKHIAYLRDELLKAGYKISHAI